MPDHSTFAPGVAVDLGANVDGDALVVTARGPLAAGLELEQGARGTAGDEGGQGPAHWAAEAAGSRCEH